MVTESEAILVVFIPLHEQYQYGIVVGLDDWAHLYELTQILYVLKTEVLWEVQAILLDRAYTACPVGSLRWLRKATRHFPAYLLQNMGSGFLVRRMVFRHAYI